jgi:phosphoglycolate phosphatase
MKKVWFFDLDGTLADTDSDIRLAWKAAIDDLLLSCPEFDSKFVAGPPIDEMAKILFPDIYTPELADKIRANFARHYDNDGFPTTKEYPGVLDVVRSLKNAGAKVYIATNKRYEGAMKMASKFGWDRVFDGIFAGDMYHDDPSVGKMKKDALLKFLLVKLGVSGDDCVMVGDTCNDFDAAKANFMESVGVKWGYGVPGDSPTRWAERPQDIFKTP